MRLAGLHRALSTGKNSGLKNKIIWGASGSFFLKILSILLSIFSTLVLARIMGARSYGVYTFVISLVSLISVPATMGLDTLLIREVAKYKSRKQWELLKGIVRWADGGASLICVGFVLIWYFTLCILSDGFEPELARSLLVAPPLLAFLVLISLKKGAIQGMGKVVEAQIPLMLILPGTFLALVLFIGYFWNVTPENAIMAQIFGAILALLLAIHLNRKNMPPEARDVIPQYLGRKWIRSALPLMFVGTVSILNHRLSLVVAGSILGPVGAGTLDVALKGSMIVTFVLVAVNVPLAPAVAELYSKGEKELLQRLITKSARGAFVLSTPAALLLIVFSDPLLSLFGKEFSAANRALSILAVGQLVNVGAGSVAVLLNMTGHGRETAKGVGIACAVNLGVSLLLIPYLKIDGAAIANALSIVVWNILMAWWVYKRIDIRSFGL